MSHLRVLALALFAMAATHAAWFRDDRHLVAAMLVFALPPLLLGVLAWRGWRRAGLTSGLVALLWFSHGVMVAWTHPEQRLFAWLEILLALVVVASASMPGLRARVRRRS